MKNIFGCCIVYFIIALTALHAQNLNRLGYLRVHPGNFVTDVWGYVDQTNGSEYAIIGANNRVAIIDVTDPEEPKEVSIIDTTPGFDIKVWQHYLYCVTGGAGVNQGKVINITDLTNPIEVGSFNSAHNIFISEDGLLFAESPGLTIYNLNNNPESPEFLWGDGTDEGHDVAVIKNRIYDFHGDGTNIYEFSFDSSFNIQLLGSINPPEIAYHHSGWVTENGNYIFICDELAVHPRPDITVWDITDLANPVKVDEYADPTATVHNLYIIGSYAYVSYYTAGFRIFDVSDPHAIKVSAHYDTNPESGEGFDGAFGVYPFLPSGNILVSDQTGLYIFKFELPTGNIEDNQSFEVESYQLFQNYPNPFNPTTKIKFTIPLNPTSSYRSESLPWSWGLVTLKVYDVLGNEVAILINEENLEGDYEITFNATGLPSGVYFYQLTVTPTHSDLKHVEGLAGSLAITKKMIILK